MTSRGLNDIYPSPNEDRILPVQIKINNHDNLPKNEKESYYDKSKIENLKTVIIPLNFGNNIASVNFSINNIEFEPNYMILNSIVFSDQSAAGTTAVLITLSSTLPLNQNRLCVIPGNADGIQKLDPEFKLTTKNINGSYNFSLSNAINGGNPNNTMGTFDYYLSLTLTFIKYKFVE